jgi:hypothetical protein
MKKLSSVILSSLVGLISIFLNVKVLAEEGTVILEPEQSPPIPTANNLWVRAEAYSTMNYYLKDAITISVAIRNTAEGTYLGNEKENLSVVVEANCHTGEALMVMRTINYIPIGLEQKQKPFDILANTKSPENQTLGIACYHYLNSKK